jgi:Fe-S cluster assembly iron-binding protein IscA
MTISIDSGARQAIARWLARDPSRPALRLSFAGGCGALGYRLTPAAAGARPGERVVSVEGLTIYADYKSAADLDGARIEVGDTPEDILVVHDRCVVGGMC